MTLALKMFCGSCGTDVTTPNHAGIYPCGTCGSTWRVSGDFARPIFVGVGQPMFTTHVFAR